MSLACLQLLLDHPLQLHVFICVLNLVREFNNLHIKQSFDHSILDVLLEIIILLSIVFYLRLGTYQDQFCLGPCRHLEDVESTCHGHHSLGLPAKEVASTVALPGSTLLLPVALADFFH